MRKKVSFLMVVLGLFMMLGLTGCISDKETVDSKQRELTDELMNEANNQIGMPNITNFYEKKMAKEIYELRDNSDLVTYTYVWSEMKGKWCFVTRSIGYGLPFSVQFSNPEKVVQGDHEMGFDLTGTNYVMTKPQAEPNGLFMPEGLSATWIMALDEESGERYPMYLEPQIMVTQRKLPRRMCDEDTLPADY